jgi:uncharacterized protein (DUF362 family)
MAGVGTAAFALRSRARGDAGGPTARLQRVHHIPAPTFAHGNRHPGVESLLFLMANGGMPLYRTAAPHALGNRGGLIARDDTVLIKVNAQWKYRGCTNSDVVRGIVQRILEHPEGFEGEVVIVENGQGRGSLNCDTTAGCDGGTNEVHANAENEAHSFSWLVQELFQDERVGERLLDDIRMTFIDENDHTTEGYRELGNVSYPCFFTPLGTRVELREGIWTGSGHDSRRLKWINVPTMKDHKDLNVTGCLKHVYGLLSMDYTPLPPHNPYEAGQVMGEFYGRVRAPLFSVLDHIWVSHGSLCGYPASTTTRRDMLVAGTDPCAMDAWSARHVLFPISGDSAHDPDIPGYLRTYLTDARDTINAYGGIRGRPVTFDAADTEVTHADQREVLLRTWTHGSDVELAWAGGVRPYRVERDIDPSFPSPAVLAEETDATEWTDPGAAGDADAYFYRVTPVL